MLASGSILYGFVNGQLREVRPLSRSEKIAEAEKLVEDIERELELALASEIDCFWTQQASRDVDDESAWRSCVGEIEDLRRALTRAEKGVDSLR